MTRSRSSSDRIAAGVRRYSFYTSDRDFDWLAFLAEFVAGAIKGLPIDIAHMDASPGIQKRLGDRPADAGGAGGDKSASSFKLQK